jgi:hypothetical protein
MQLRRSGQFELALAIEKFYKTRPAAMSRLTIDYVANLAPEKVAGVLGNLEERVMKSYKNWKQWWVTSTVAQRETGLGLLCYYKGPRDTRTLPEVMRKNEKIFSSKITKVFESTMTKVHAIMRGIMAEAKHPIARKQLEEFLKMYQGKPGMAADNVKFLTSTPVTHTWKEEAKALAVLRVAAQKLWGIIANKKLSIMADTIQGVLDDAEDMCSDVGPAGERAAVTGPEAKAALLIRNEVMLYVLKCSESVAVIQRTVRCFTKRSMYKKLIKKRRWAIDLTHRFARGFLARNMACWLREQQAADWEQLWNSARQLMYYYSKSLGMSTYEEPRGPYRPLVRDRLSAQLVQAWPDLDSEGQTADGFVKTQAAPEAYALADALKTCGVCMFRRAVRVCLDCLTYPKLADGTMPSDWQAPTAYCFLCYTRAHTEPDQQKHRYQDKMEKVEDSYLFCCLCRSPATRKCQGPMTDTMLEDMMEAFKRTKVETWSEVLLKFKIEGDRKVEVLLDRIKPTKQATRGVEAGYGTPAQVSQLRGALEQIRSECDELYCSPCYKAAHKGGKRQTHKWQGFVEYDTACGMCHRAPASLSCDTCSIGLEEQAGFCAPCFSTFHAKGKKRRHEMKLICEPCQDEETMCPICTRRVAAFACDFCDKEFCDSCFECVHKDNCDEKTVVTASHDHGFWCILCQEPADQRCKQCGDLYCSNTWMGNPGCWAKFHDKGFRLKHYCQELEPHEFDAIAAADNRREAASVAASVSQSRTAGDDGSVGGSVSSMGSKSTPKSKSARRSKSSRKSKSSAA